jgi:hypothetical protein
VTSACPYRSNTTPRSTSQDSCDLALQDPTAFSRTDSYRILSSYSMMCAATTATWIACTAGLPKRLWSIGRTYPPRPILTLQGSTYPRACAHSTRQQATKSDSDIDRKRTPPPPRQTCGGFCRRNLSPVLRGRVVREREQNLCSGLLLRENRAYFRYSLCACQLTGLFSRIILEEN